MKREILSEMGREINKGIKEADIFVKILSEGTNDSGEFIDISLFNRVGKLLRVRSATLFIHNNLDMSNEKDSEIFKKIILDQIERIKKD